MCKYQYYRKQVISEVIYRVALFSIVALRIIMNVKKCCMLLIGGPKTCILPVDHGPECDKTQSQPTASTSP